MDKQIGEVGLILRARQACMLSMDKHARYCIQHACMLTACLPSCLLACSVSDTTLDVARTCTVRYVTSNEAPSPVTPLAVYSARSPNTDAIQ
jgi:hypothetical protein